MQKQHESCTKGTVTKIHKCWWLKVNTKAARLHALDGAVFPHIATVTYIVDGKTYKKHKYIGLSADTVGIMGNVDVYYDKDKPSRCEIKL